jgi:hypothetical protein
MSFFKINLLTRYSTGRLISCEMIQSRYRLEMKKELFQCNKKNLYEIFLYRH